EVLATEHRREPGRDREHDRVRHEVAGQDPRRLVLARRQAPGDVRDRDVGHARVEELHERRERDGDRDQPGRMLRTPLGRVHRTSTSGSTDMPGASTIPSGSSSNTSFTGTRCTTFTKLPVAFSGGSRLKRTPVPTYT